MNQPRKKCRDFAYEKNRLEEKLKDAYLAYQDFARKGSLRIRRIKPLQTQLSQISSSQQQNASTTPQGTSAPPTGANIQMEMTENQYYYNKGGDDIRLCNVEMQTEYNERLCDCLQQPFSNPKINAISHEQSSIVQDLMVTHNEPIQTSQKLLRHLHRRMAYLDSKKKMTVSRYAHFLKHIATPTQASKWDQYLLSRINLLDLELSAIISRIERIKNKSDFEKTFNGASQKPIVVNEFGNKIYRIDDDGEMCFANLSREDFEIYLRTKLFDSKCRRNMWKFYSEVKWIHYSKRYAMVEYVNDTMNKSRIKDEQAWKEYVKKIKDHFVQKVIEKYPNQMTEMRATVAKFFEQMEVPEKEYAELGIRSDFLPLWPSTLMEQNDVLAKAYRLCFKQNNSQQKDIHTMLFQMSISLSILFENQVEVSQFNMSSNEDEKNSIYTANSNSNKDQLSYLEEGPMKTLIASMLIPKRTVVYVQAEWTKLLLFEPKHDQLQQHLINKLVNTPIVEDSSTRLIVSFLGNKDFDSTRQFIHDHSQNIIANYEDKFYLFIDNTFYADKTDNSISLELLVDVYKEGLENKKKAFETGDSKTLRSKESLKKEHLKAINGILEEQVPQQLPLQTAYSFMFLKCIENRRKLTAVLNALRSIERRITYSLIRILDCEFPREVDDEFLVRVSEDTSQQKGKESTFLNPNQAKDPQVKRRQRITSFSSTKNLYDEKFRDSLTSSYALGRFDNIEYQDNERYDDVEDEDDNDHAFADLEIPEIYLRGDEKDGLAGFGQFIIFDVAVKDLESVENRLVRTMSIYLSKMEKVCRVKNFYTIVDRYTTLTELYSWELKFQFAKLRLAEQHMQILENISDPGESFALAEMIMHQIKELPAVDFNSNSFVGSYKATVNKIKVHTKLVKTLFQFQKNNEIKATDLFHEKLQRQMKEPYARYLAYCEQNQGGQSLSKEANQQQNMQFLEIRAQKLQAKQLGLMFNYDQFCLSRDMEEVFKNIVTKKINGNSNRSSQSSNISTPSIGKQQQLQVLPEENSQQSKSTDQMLHKKFEGGPHYYYATQHLPKHRFSPSVEEDNFLNFYESTAMAAKISALIPSIMNDLQSTLPQKSVLAQTLLQTAIIQQIIDSFKAFQFSSVGPIEDSVICEDESIMLGSLQSTVTEILTTIEKTNEEIKLGGIQTYKSDAFIQQHRELLQGLDYATLETALKSEYSDKSKNYRELFLHCNLLEFVSIRENTLKYLFERKVLARIFKEQMRYYSLTPRKHADLFFPNTLQLTIDSNKSNSQSNHHNKPKKTLSFHQEIDDSSSGIYNFTSEQSLQQLFQTDELDYFRTMSVYEYLCLQSLINSVRLTAARMDNIQLSVINIELMMRNNAAAESSNVDFSMLYLNATNLANILSGLGHTKQAIGVTNREKYIFSPLGNRYQPRDGYQKQFTAAYGDIYKEHVVTMGAREKRFSEIAEDMLLAKKMKILKGVLSRGLLCEVLAVLNTQWSRVECLHITQNIQRILNCSSGLEEQIQVEQSVDQLVQEQIYNNPKKKTKLNRLIGQGGASASASATSSLGNTVQVNENLNTNHTGENAQEEGKTTTTTNNANNSKQSTQQQQQQPPITQTSQLIWTGLDWEIPSFQQLTLPGQQWLLTYDFQQYSTGNQLFRDTQQLTFNQLIKLSTLSPIEFVSLHNQLETQVTTQRKVAQYLRRVSGGQSSIQKTCIQPKDWRLFSDDSSSSKLAKILRAILQLISNHLTAASIALPNQELTLLSHMLTFSLQAQEISPDNLIENTIRSGRDLSQALIAFDKQTEEKIQLDVAKKVEKSLNNSKVKKQTPEDSLINSLVTTKEQQQQQQQPVGASLGSQNLNLQSQRQHGVIVSEIIDGLVRKLESHSNLSESFRGLQQDLQRMKVSLNNGNNNNSSPIKDSSNNTKAISGKVLIKELKNRSRLIHTKLYTILMGHFLSACTRDPSSNLANQGFNLHSAIFAPFSSNTLNLAHFNTYFYSHNLPQNSYSIMSGSEEDSAELFWTMHKRPFKKSALNMNRLKTKLLTFNLPINMHKYSQKLQHNAEVLNAQQAQLLFAPTEQFTRIFNKTKYLVGNSQNSIGLANYSSAILLTFGLIGRISEEERCQIGGSLRNLEGELKPYKVFKNEGPERIQEELKYIEAIARNQILIQARSIYAHAASYPLQPIQFARYYAEQKEGVQERVGDVKNNLFEYEKRGFIVADSELYRQLNTKLPSDDQDSMHIRSHLQQICLENMFLVEDMKKGLIEDSIDILQIEYAVGSVQENIEAALAKQAQRGDPKQQRLQVNPIFSSPLFVDTKSIFMPTLPKVAFVQAFVNRFRNKVSRVDLLSSGFGFVISVNDLEDCIQSLSKSVQSFGEKEIKKRMDSAQYLFDLQNSKIKAQAKTVEILKQKLKAVELYQQNNIDAIVHEKGNNLIYEMDKMRRNQKAFSRYLLSIEKDVELEVRKDMSDEIVKLNNDKEILRNQFADFKRILTGSLTNDIKLAGKDIQQQIHKKSLEVWNQVSKFQHQQSILEQEGEDELPSGLIQPTLSSKVTGSQFNDQQQRRRSQQPRVSVGSIEHDQGITKQPQQSGILLGDTNTTQILGEEDQEDLEVYDPVVLMKQMNKLRSLYLLRLAGQRAKYEQQITLLEQQLGKQQELQDQLSESKKEESIFKREIVCLHNSLKAQEKQSASLQIEVDSLEKEKLKLEKERDDLKLTIILNKTKQTQADKWLAKTQIASSTSGKDQQGIVNSSEKARRKTHDGFQEEEQQTAQGGFKDADGYLEEQSRKEQKIQRAVQQIEQNNQKQLSAYKQKLNDQLALNHNLLAKINSQGGGFAPQTQTQIMWKNQCQELYIKCEQINREKTELLDLAKDISREVQAVFQQRGTNNSAMQIEYLTELAQKVEQFNFSSLPNLSEELMRIPESDPGSQLLGMANYTPLIVSNSHRKSLLPQSLSQQPRRTGNGNGSGGLGNNNNSNSDISFLFQLKSNSNSSNHYDLSPANRTGMQSGRQSKTNSLKITQTPFSETSRRSQLPSRNKRLDPLNQTLY